VSAEDQFSRNIEKLESLIEQAKEVNREGREILKDIKVARKELLDSKQEIEDWARESVDNRFGPQMQKEFDELTPKIQELYTKVSNEVGKLTDPVELTEKLMRQHSLRIKKIAEIIDAFEDSDVLKRVLAVAEAELAEREKASAQ